MDRCTLAAALVASGASLFALRGIRFGLSAQGHTHLQASAVAGAASLAAVGMLIGTRAGGSPSLEPTRPLAADLLLGLVERARVVTVTGVTASDPNRHQAYRSAGDVPPGAPIAAALGPGIVVERRDPRVRIAASL
jgi:hypothetical protein